MFNELFNTPIPVTINGKNTTMVFNANAHAEFEALSGVDLITMLRGMAEGTVPKIGVLRALVWSLLITAQPDLKPSDVGAWLTLREFQRLSPYIGQAMKQYMPDIGGEDAGEHPTTAPTESGKTAASIGANSTD